MKSPLLSSLLSPIAPANSVFCFVCRSLFILKDIADIVDDTSIYTGEPVVATILEVA